MRCRWIFGIESQKLSIDRLGLLISTGDEQSPCVCANEGPFFQLSFRHFFGSQNGDIASASLLAFSMDDCKQIFGREFQRRTG